MGRLAIKACVIIRGIGGQLETAARKMERAGLARRGDVLGRCEERHLVIEVDQLLAVVHRLEGRCPSRPCAPAGRGRNLAM